MPTERAQQTPPPAQVAPPPHAGLPSPQAATPSQPEPPPTQVATPPPAELSSTSAATPPHPELPPAQLAVPHNQQPQQTEVNTDAKETELAKPKAAVSQESPGVSSLEKPKAPGQKISRRTVLIGLGGLVVVGGGITWFALSKGQNTPATAIPDVGTTLYTYTGHSNVVLAVAWSPDGKRIASASSDKTVQVWDAADGGNGYTYRGHSTSVFAVAWSPDGKRIASGSGDKTVQVWAAG